jgi:hypothetical protein
MRHLGLAKVVRAELPETWRAWCAGRITEWKATLVARETVFLSRDDRKAVDAAVCGDLDAVERMGDRELAQACQQEAYRLDPAGYVERRRRAEADRNVTIRPAPDGMVWLSSLLPMKQGVAAHVALSRSAASARAVGDPRSRGQVMADTLVESVLARAALQSDAQTTWRQPETAQPTEQTRARGAGVTIDLVMTDAALFGSGDDAAYVDGYGTIPAELAREIVKGACEDDEEVWLRRLYASPTTGELVGMDSVSRRFRNNLARFIRLRDQTCRTPWCGAPIRHTDHAEDHDVGGVTSAANGQGLCEACNHAKQAPGWRARGAPGWREHWIRTTTPTGHTYLSAPPSLVERRLRAVVDYARPDWRLTASSVPA